MTTDRRAALLREHVTHTLATLHTDTERLIRHLELDRHHPSRPDGYPTRTPGADPHSRSSVDWQPCPECGGTGREQPGVPCEPCVGIGKIAAPAITLTSVERAVDTLTAWHDEHRRRTQRALDQLVDGLNALRRAHDTLTGLDSVEVPVEVLAANEALWCTHHQTHGFPNEPRAADRGLTTCRWCADFRQAVGQLPPKPLLELRAQGKRITDADIRRHIPGHRGAA